MPPRSITSSAVRSMPASFIHMEAVRDARPTLPIQSPHSPSNKGRNSPKYHGQSLHDNGLRAGVNVCRRGKPRTLVEDEQSRPSPPGAEVVEVLDPTHRPAATAPDRCNPGPNTHQGNPTLPGRAEMPLPGESRAVTGVLSIARSTLTRYSQLVVRTPNTRFPSPRRPISPMSWTTQPGSQKRRRWTFHRRLFRRAVRDPLPPKSTKKNGAMRRVWTDSAQQ